MNIHEKFALILCRCNKDVVYWPLYTSFILLRKSPIKIHGSIHLDKLNSILDNFNSIHDNFTRHSTMF